MSSRRSTSSKCLDSFKSFSFKGLKDFERYQTFRVDKFDEFMKADSRGVALFELYKPGTPEYGEFFEEILGPDLLAMAKGKLEEGESSGPEL